MRRESAFLLLAMSGLLAALLAGPALVGAEGPSAVILADPADPFYALAQEIAQQEMLPVAGCARDALASAPAR
ncbi:MAG: hypothetical protein ACUVWR_13535 [Anaerolineae bacterium]